MPAIDYPLEVEQRQTASAPLLTRGLNQPLATILKPLKPLSKGQTQIKVDEFLSHVAALAAELPDAPYAINLCANRYLFLVSFCACLTRAQTNLLPPNASDGTLQSIRERYPDSYLLHDGCLQNPDILGRSAQLDLNQITLGSRSASGVPEIALSHLAAVVFTSGSTGQPKAVEKSWNTLVTSTHINAQQMLADIGTPHQALATVPGQHMWGLETSVLMPLVHPISVSDARPFYPLDICKALENLCAPRLLITTPVHLRSLLRSELALPPVQKILCATAPLSADLAEATEQAFTGQLLEIYGCSEAGSMAIRSTAQSNQWQLFPQLHLDRDAEQSNGEPHWRLSAEHLPESISLQDHIVPINRSRQSDQPLYFELEGRNEDMLKIAGKRGSLLELNSILQRCGSVRDGVVFVPQHADNADIARPAALVELAPGSTQSTVARFFRTQIDPVFCPRPIYVTRNIPRQANGKIDQPALRALYQQLREERMPLDAKVAPNDDKGQINSKR